MIYNRTSEVGGHSEVQYITLILIFLSQLKFFGLIAFKVLKK